MLKRFEREFSDRVARGRVRDQKMRWARPYRSGMKRLIVLGAPAAVLGLGIPAVAISAVVAVVFWLVWTAPAGRFM